MSIVVPDYLFLTVEKKKPEIREMMKYDVNLQEKFSLGPGFEPVSPVLRANTFQTATIQMNHRAKQDPGPNSSPGESLFLLN